MSSQTVIKVEGLSKAYTIWSSPAARLHGPLLGRIGQLPFVPQAVRAGCRRLSHESFRQFHALRDIAFEVRRGESVGIIGLNGSGKSTLLQLLAGTLEPTAGHVEVNGRIAALLELGSGFNPEFTGRENVVLNATILGLKPEEIEARFGPIAQFADIGEFIEQPVKTYSSGMVVRLAFAVLTQVNPDILVIDEALAVGDFLFQQKCFDCLREFQRRGCTFLFVSHAMGTVLDLCDRAMFLERGQLRFDGPAKEAVDLYEAHSLKARFSNGPAMRIVEKAKPPPQDPPSPAAGSGQAAGPQERVGGIATEDVELCFVRIQDARGVERSQVVSEESLRLSVGILSRRDLLDPHVGFKVRDRMGRVVFETSTLCMGRPPGPVARGQVLVADFVFEVPLAEGEYSITVGVAEGRAGGADYREALLFLHDTRTFQVLRNHAAIVWNGVANLKPGVSFRRLNGKQFSERTACSTQS